MSVAVRRTGYFFGAHHSITLTISHGMDASSGLWRDPDRLERYSFVRRDEATTDSVRWVWFERVLFHKSFLDLHGTGSISNWWRRGELYSGHK
jgi:hypothetical protein